TAAPMTDSRVCSASALVRRIGSSQLSLFTYMRECIYSSPSGQASSRPLGPGQHAREVSDEIRCHSEVEPLHPRASIRMARLDENRPVDPGQCRTFPSALRITAPVSDNCPAVRN